MSTITRKKPFDPDINTSDLSATVASENFYNINSYLELGTRNSVPLINRFSEEDGYLVLFTDLDSHIEKNDIVYITRNSGNSELDNFEDYKFEDNYPFTNFSQGYKVINVDKNTNKIIINKIFRDTISNLDLNGHYISVVKGEKGSISNCSINGTLWKKSSTQNNEISQAIFLESNDSGNTFNSKYKDDYKSLKRSIQSDGLQITEDNFTYGYIYHGFKNLKSYNNLYNCNIKKGNYYNCNIFSDLQEDNKLIIKDGYFENCIISNYIINGGDFINCTIKSSCTWLDGKFDNIDGSKFEPKTWTNGTWGRGNFSGKTWENGTFNGDNNTLFIDSIWENGTFTNGIFSGSTWKNGNFIKGKMYYSDWIDGKLNGSESEIYFSKWSGGTFDKGLLSGSTWYNGTMRTGNIYDSIWINGEVTIDAKFINIEWYNGKFKGGIMDNCTWYNGSFFKGKMRNNSIWYDGIFFNGTMKNSTWSAGTWKDGNMENCYWSGSTWENGSMENSFINKIYWKNGFMDNCTFSTNSATTDIIILDGTFVNIDSSYDIHIPDTEIPNIPISDLNDIHLTKNKWKKHKNLWKIRKYGLKN